MKRERNYPKIKERNQEMSDLRKREREREDLGDNSHFFSATCSVNLLMIIPDSIESSEEESVRNSRSSTLKIDYLLSSIM